MAQCNQCSGNGWVFIEEDGVHVQHPGLVAEESPLVTVAISLATHQESERRRYLDSEEDMEGYNFLAAERMMHPSEYFLMRVDKAVDGIMEQLLSMDSSSQELLIALNNMPQNSIFARFNSSVLREMKEKQPIYDDSDVLF